MNNTHKITALLILCTILGVAYYGWQQQWIIINLPSCRSTNPTETTYTKRHAHLWIWHETGYTPESLDLLWGNDNTHNAQQVIQAVLTLAHAEHIIPHKVCVERVLKNCSAPQLLILLDKSPLNATMPIGNKLMLIESILKSMRENGLKQNSLYFLVDNQPMLDEHLDFRQAWPIDGFCS